MPIAHRLFLCVAPSLAVIPAARKYAKSISLEIPCNLNICFKTSVHNCLCIANNKLSVLSSRNFVLIRAGGVVASDLQDLLIGAVSALRLSAGRGIINHDDNGWLCATRFLATTVSSPRMVSCSS